MGGGVKMAVWEDEELESPQNQGACQLLEGGTLTPKEIGGTPK